MNFLDVTTSDVDTHTDLSIGTEFSFDADTIASIQPQNGGGLRNFFERLNPFKTSNSNNDNKVLEAFAKGNISDAGVAIKLGFVNNYCAKDGNGKTIFKHIIENYNSFPNKEELLAAIFASNNVESFINERDNKGDAPLHAAVKSGKNDLAEKLIANGADKTLQNNEGVSVISEDSATSAGPNITSIPPFIPINTSGQSNSDKNISSLIAALKKPKNIAPESELTDLGSDILLTSTQTAGTATSMTIPSNTEDFVKSLVKAYSNKSQNTSNNIMNGGKLSIIESMIAGKRKMRTNRKISKKTSKRSMKREAVPSEITDSVVSGAENELARLIKSQATDIHERVVKTIMDLLNVDEAKASAYKAILYRKVQKEHPNLSNLDRALEMQKEATKENLEQIDNKEVNEMVSIIEKKRSERASTGPKNNAEKTEETTEEKPKKARKTKKADATESALTEYSVSTDFTDSE